MPVVVAGGTYGRGGTAGVMSVGGGGIPGGVTAAGAAGARVARSGAIGGGVVAHPMTVLRMPRPRHSICKRETINCIPCCV